MVIIIYLSIILSTVTQSATTKAFNRCCRYSVIFNAIKSSTSLLFFALAAAWGFIPHLPTVILGVLYGICICISMYSGYKALSLGPMALTSMLVSFSVLIPLIWGMTIGDEILSIFQAVAIVFWMIAIILTNADKFKANQQLPSNYIAWFCFIGVTFFANGICSIFQKQHQKLYPGAYVREFMFFASLVCCVVFVTVAVFTVSVKDFKQAKGKLFGVISGSANGMASFLTLILAGYENASILFPTISAGTILASLVCGRVIFKEKLKLIHYLALVFGIAAVVLLNCKF